MIHQVAIKSLPQEWLWCETWCDDTSKVRAKTIDLVRPRAVYSDCDDKLSQKCEECKLTQKNIKNMIQYDFFFFPNSYCKVGKV